MDKDRPEVNQLDRRRTRTAAVVVARNFIESAKVASYNKSVRISDARKREVRIRFFFFFAACPGVRLKFYTIFFSPYIFISERLLVSRARSRTHTSVFKGKSPLVALLGRVLGGEGGGGGGKFYVTPGGKFS